MEHIKVNEVYLSVQGESTWAGLPCVFIRLTGCHLRCAYCDTEHAFYQGDKRPVDQVIEEAVGYGCGLVEVTGGEPLLQPGVHALMRSLCDRGMTVLLETSGACDISVCDPRVIRVMDIKTPGSGEVERNLWSNIDHLTRRDEVKFVICDEADYRWAKGVIEEHRLCESAGAVLVSAAAACSASGELAGCAGLSLEQLAGWVIADRLAVRVQTQLHKVIWGPSAQGV